MGKDNFDDFFFTNLKSDKRLRHKRLKSKSLPIFILKWFLISYPSPKIVAPNRSLSPITYLYQFMLL